MTFRYFNRHGKMTGVTVNSSAVVCYYSDPLKEESVIIELSNGSKFELKTILGDVEKWLGDG